MKKLLIVLCIICITLLFVFSIYKTLHNKKLSTSYTATLQAEEALAFKLENTDSEININSDTNLATQVVHEEDNFMLSIPKIELSVVVRNLADNEVLDDDYGIPNTILKEWGVVRYPKLSYPGENGITAIAGHRDISGSPFLELDKLEIGDSIYIYLKNTTEPLLYVVTNIKEVVPNDLSVFEETQDKQELRLTTCLVGSTKKRLVIFAERSFSNGSEFQ